MGTRYDKHWILTFIKNLRVFHFYGPCVPVVFRFYGPCVPVVFHFYGPCVPVVFQLCSTSTVLVFQLCSSCVPLLRSLCSSCVPLLRSLCSSCVPSIVHHPNLWEEKTVCIIVHQVLMTLANQSAFFNGGEFWRLILSTKTKGHSLSNISGLWWGFWRGRAHAFFSWFFLVPMGIL